MWAKKKNSLLEVRKNIEILGIKLPKVIHVAGTNEEFTFGSKKEY